MQYLFSIFKYYAQSRYILTGIHYAAYKISHSIRTKDVQALSTVQDLSCQWFDTLLIACEGGESNLPTAMAVISLYLFT